MADSVCKLRDWFCFICGHFTHHQSRRKIFPTIEEPYFLFFGIRKLCEAWIPKTVCTTCESGLLTWYKGGTKALPFSAPVMWIEPEDHKSDTCYFCVNYKFGRSRRHYAIMTYEATNNVILPEVRCEGVPVPQPPTHTFSANMTYANTEIAAAVENISDISYLPPDGLNICPNLIDQAYFEDLVRDLGLTKEKAEILCSRLKNRNLIKADVKVTSPRKRHADLESYFKKSEELVYCCSIEEVLKYLKLPLDSSAWRLFIDSSKHSLKAVLLHNGNQHPSIPVAYSTKKEETYANISNLLNKIEYYKYKWEVCADFKMIAILTGMQTGYTKYMCFLCKWDSRATSSHYHVKYFEERKENIIGDLNVIHESLVPKDKVILPPLHIKLGVVKNFIKSLNTQGNAFKRIQTIFPRLSAAKLKEGMLVGPDIRKLLHDEEFYGHLSDMQKTAFDFMQLVISEFLGNSKAQNYAENIESMLIGFNNIGVKMSLKLHFLHSHLNFFKENLGAVSDEHGERFHQDIKVLEERFKGKSQSVMLAEYVWGLYRNLDPSEHSRQAKYRKAY